MARAVGFTNDEATLSKVSCAVRGYVHDPVLVDLSIFRQRAGRAPLIDRGYWIRMYWMRRLAHTFIYSHIALSESKAIGHADNIPKDHPQVQVINLGAGFDTTYWALFGRSQNSLPSPGASPGSTQNGLQRSELNAANRVLWIDVDSEIVIQNRCSLFQSLYAETAANDSQRAPVTVAYDLRGIAKDRGAAFLALLRGAGLRQGTPTLVIAEAVLQYLPTKHANTVVAFVYGPLNAAVVPSAAPSLPRSCGCSSCCLEVLPRSPPLASFQHSAGPVEVCQRPAGLRFLAFDQLPLQLPVSPLAPPATPSLKVEGTDVATDGAATRRLTPFSHVMCGALEARAAPLRTHFSALDSLTRRGIDTTSLGDTARKHFGADGDACDLTLPYCCGVRSSEEGNRCPGLVSPHREECTLHVSARTLALFAGAVPTAEKSRISAIAQFDEYESWFEYLRHYAIVCGDIRHLSRTCEGSSATLRSSFTSPCAEPSDPVDSKPIICAAMPSLPPNGCLTSEILDQSLVTHISSSDDPAGLTCALSESSLAQSPMVFEEVAAPPSYTYSAAVTLQLFPSANHNSTSPVINKDPIPTTVMLTVGGRKSPQKPTNSVSAVVFGHVCDVGVRPCTPICRSDTCKPHHIRVTSSGSTPPPVFRHALAVVGTARFALFGGKLGEDSLNDRVYVCSALLVPSDPPLMRFELQLRWSVVHIEQPEVPHFLTNTPHISTGVCGTLLRFSCAAVCIECSEDHAVVLLHGGVDSSDSVICDVATVHLRFTDLRSSHRLDVVGFVSCHLIQLTTHVGAIVGETVRVFGHRGALVAADNTLAPLGILFLGGCAGGPSGSALGAGTAALFLRFRGTASNLALGWCESLSSGEVAASVQDHSRQGIFTWIWEVWRLPLAPQQMQKVQLALYNHDISLCDRGALLHGLSNRSPASASGWITVSGGALQAFSFGRVASSHDIRICPPSIVPSYVPSSPFSAIAPRWLGSPAIFRDLPLGPCLQWSDPSLLVKLLGDRRGFVHVARSNLLSWNPKNFSFHEVELASLVRYVFGEIDIDTLLPDFSNASAHNTKTNKTGSPIVLIRGRPEKVGVYFRATGKNIRKDRADFWRDFPILAQELTYPLYAPHATDRDLDRSPDAAPIPLIPQSAYFQSVLRISTPGLCLWPHYDTYDNFLVCICGNKRVVLWPPTAESRAVLMVNSGESSSPLVAPADMLPWTPSRQDIVLRPGDVLYIPALWFHGVSCVGNAGSVGVNVFFRGPNVSQAVIDRKDLYGNKDLLPVGKIRAATALIDGALRDLPHEQRAFYFAEVSAMLRS